MLIRRTSLAAAVAVATFGLLATGPALADYAKPPERLLKVLKAPPPPAPNVAPGGQRLLLTTAQTYPSISRVAQPYLKLAGVRLEPKNRSRHDTPGGYGIPACVADFTLVDIGSGKETKVNLPQGCATGALWSADGSHFAFQNAVDTSVQLWVGDAATGQVKQIPNVQLNPIFGNTVQWLGGSQNLLVKLVPANQGPAPSNGGVPTGPDAQESLGSSGESSTYEARDTLTSVHDEKLFAYYGASQLAVVDTAAGSVRPVGQPALFNDVSAAPDGVHVLTESIKAPYSHAVTYQRFANDVAVLDIASGKSTPIASLPLADRVPVHGVPEGPRGFDWRATDPATLVYAEALDKGDWKVNVPHRDRVLMLKAPFNGKPTEITRTTQRFEGFAWTADPAVAFQYENDENRHWMQTRVVDVDQPKKEGRLLWDMSSDELYANPGNLVFTRLPNGAQVVRREGNHVFLSGRGASPQGDRPFLDRLDLGTLKSERLFRSSADAYEQFLGFSSTPGRYLTWHQSVIDPPNAFIRQQGEAVADAKAGEAQFASTATALTKLVDPTPEVRQIKKQLVTYKRADGVDLSFTLYTPPGYKEGQRVP
ncbi:TolB family protein, partial [Stenotrophomonas maltophilia]